MSNGYIPSRKICRSDYHKGSRWLLSVYFTALTRNNDGTAKYLQHECKTCANHRRNEMKKAARVEIPKEIKRELRREGDRMRKAEERRSAGVPQRRFTNSKRHLTDYIDVLVDAKRFVKWLNEYLARPDSLSIARLAEYAGMSARRIQILKQGWYYKNGRRYRTKNVSLDVIIKILEAAHEDHKLLQIAPPKAIRKYRWKPGGPPLWMFDSPARIAARKRARNGYVAGVPNKFLRPELRHAVANEDVPDVISEYQRRRRARRPRDG